MFVYCITCSANGKRYVGLTTKTLDSRMREHVYAAVKRNSTCALHCAIRKYGAEQFTIELLETCDSVDLLKVAECQWITRLNTHISNQRGYNTTFGGDGATGMKHSDAFKERLSRDRRGFKHPMFGKRLSDDEKRVQHERSPKKRSVEQIDVKTGTVIRVFASMREAARSFGSKDHSSISKCCNQVEHALTAFGYKWRFQHVVHHS